MRPEGTKGGGYNPPKTNIHAGLNTRAQKNDAVCQTAQEKKTEQETKEKAEPETKGGQ